MRVLWSLPKAAPALLRHLGAYVELAALDFERAKRDAVGGMGGGFVALALIAMVYRSKAAAEEPPFLDSVRREWKEDSVILERILADDDT